MFGLPTWLIVSIGLVFNISSALVTHFIIEGKDEQVNLLSMQENRNKKEMDLLWLQIEGIERKRETLYLLLNQGAINQELAAAFSKLLESHLQQEVSYSFLQDIEKVDSSINNYQDSIREKINHKFFLNLELSELEMELKKEISSLRNWSIFLQMIGLSLILARDLNRRI
ncbi:MAG: hypothetical protein V7782_03165 [Psychromonas sp.]